MCWVSLISTYKSHFKIKHLFYLISINFYQITFYFETSFICGYQRNSTHMFSFRHFVCKLVDMSRYAYNLFSINKDHPLFFLTINISNDLFHGNDELLPLVWLKIADPNSNTWSSIPNNGLSCLGVMDKSHGINNVRTHAPIYK